MKSLNNNVINLIAKKAMQDAQNSAEQLKKEQEKLGKRISQIEDLLK